MIDFFFYSCLSDSLEIIEEKPFGLLLADRILSRPLPWDRVKEVNRLITDSQVSVGLSKL